MHFHRLELRVGTAALIIIAGSAALARDLTAIDKQLLSRDFGKHLKDPFSARYLWAPVVISRGESVIHRYCGKVNAKNSYGAYTGFTSFVGSITTQKGKVTYGTNLTWDAEPGVAERMCIELGLDPDAAK